MRRPLLLALLAVSGAPACLQKPAAVTVAPPPAPPAALEDGAAVPVSTKDPSWGSRTAPVTVVLFGDLECPFTGKILPTVQALESKYGESSLRIVWKDYPLPFHPQARPAAEAAEAIFALGGAGAFWTFWREALSHQGELTPASFAAWANEAGVDGASFARALDGHATRPKVDGDLQLVSKLGVEGTPTFYVNGVQVVGAQPVDKLAEVVDGELVKAKARLAAGVAPDAIYADAAKTNWKPPQPDQEDTEDRKTVWLVPIGDAPVLGNPDAPVTIVEFSDFQCPYCKKAEPVLKAIRQQYGDKVRIVWKDEPLPFHKHALPAASLAREARAEKGDSGFWAAHDALFESQPNLADEDLTTIGNALGLDPAKVKGALAGGRVADLQPDLDEADDVQAEGTPHFFVNGRRLVGAQPLPVFQAIIDEEIRHAEGLVAPGTSPHGVYDAMMKSASPSPLPEVRAVAPRAAAPFRGAPHAPVVIEEFADFQCPYCARADATLAEVEKRYPGKVKIVWRNLPLPFHTHAREAAEAALEAQRQKGNAGFWAMHDRLYKHQHDDDGAGLERRALDIYARECNLDQAAFDRALDAHSHKREIEEDTQAADAAHLEGTPAFLVGNYLISGAQPIGAFRRVIDEVLANGPGKPSAAEPKAK